MTTWTTDDLDRIGAAEELELTPHRDDGSVRPYVTMWVVRVDDDVYVRSAHGPGNGWYRRAVASGTGRIRVGGVEAAYHAKYDRYGPRIVGSVVGPDAADVTVRLVPSVADRGTAGGTS